ncbi:MAG: hypothetical protein JSS21_05365 [Proteobacteria bacterium]|nr:hypothetical protein [Pseudomonadota bacterium]
MCPICIGAATLAAVAGTGSAGGLATLVAVKLHIKRKNEEELSRSESAKAASPVKPGDKE